MTWIAPIHWPTFKTTTPLLVFDSTKNNQARNNSTSVDQALLYLLANAAEWVSDKQFCTDLEQYMLKLHSAVFSSNRPLALLCRVVQNFAHEGFILPSTFLSPGGINYWDEPTPITPAEALAKIQTMAYCKNGLCYDRELIINNIKNLLDVTASKSNRQAKGYAATYIMLYLVACHLFLEGNDRFRQVVLAKINEFQNEVIVNHIFNPFIPFLGYYLTGEKIVPEQKKSIVYWLDL